MADEIEAKARCADLDAVRRKLTGFGARQLRAGLERNVCFDTPDGSLRKSDSLLRLRQYGGEVLLTFKGPRKKRGAPVKNRVEVELEVSDFDKMSSLLENLGFPRVWAYEKKREEWTLGAVKVCLDTVPVLGEYVEVEAATEGEVLSVIDRLGVPRGDITPLTHVELFGEAVGSRGRQLPDMTFKEGERE